jgi:glycosyltransferase involved in cell wall biosynthesis
MQDKASPLRVLVCAFTCTPGGGPPSIAAGGESALGWSLVLQLARFHRLVVLTHADLRPHIESALKPSSNGNIEFHYIALPRWLEALKDHDAGGIQFYAYLWQWRAYFAARRLHRKIHFDLFHHLTFANDWMASIIGALLPIPYVRGPGGGAHRVPGEFRRKFALRPRLWEYVRKGLQWVFKHDPFFAMGQRRAGALLMANREAFEALPARWQKKAQLLSVNGVSLEKIPRPAEANPDGRRLKLLTAGRLIPLKGFDLAIRAFRLFFEDLKRERQGIRAELTIVGDGPEDARLRTQIDDLIMGDHVHLVKWMPREELFREMAECDAFVFPSLRDGGGAVVVEAMAAGKPVICFDMAGPGLHVTEECGIKVAAGSPEQAVEDIAAAFRRLALDPELRAEMGRASRRRAEQVYDWSRVAERIESAYEEALGRVRRPDEGDEPEGVSESSEVGRAVREQVPAGQ